jgi:hypothetical protein
MSDAPAAPADQQDPAPPPARDAYGQAQAAPAAQPPAAQPPRPAYGLPAEVTLKPQTFVSMRINQPLASNKNAVGDTFSGTLTQPIVVNGIVVAQRGQMVYGRVEVAEKVKGVHRLGVELTSLTLADGSQVAVHTQLVSRQGGMMPGGQEAGIITTTTASGAGAGAGLIGVLATHNKPSIIYPETALTFQTENAVTINTGNSSGAFRYVGPDDYSRPATQTVHVAQPRGYAYGPGYYPYSPYYYPYYGWGPSLFIGGGFGFGGFR